ncbi:glycoside hydrolase family 16 protein [Kribbella antibiotica]|uniref:Glycoside hydrolase family 16 protein n=1 Tax=Kribbella antibiotica TaxID=190195 RepID=A0A4V2YQ98_9ACTN|nr:glycoside hydrolase family 16 protein [Kribbella antibiotica]TDD61287.1 glycoside hydrolase family 16 protein [Kribbella antibiotica]
MSRIRLVAVLTAAAITSSSLVAATANAYESSAVRPLAISWQQEFNEPAGSGPDPGVWNFDLGGEPTWGNEEWQYFTDRPENVSTDGQGNLVISARKEQLAGMENCLYGTCDITSGRITTKGKFSQTYGTFEARIKIPGGQGLWPAFWMMGSNIDQAGWPGNGEIDVMEVVGKEPGTLYGTAHGPGYHSENGPGGQINLPAGQNWADDFHTYAVNWSPGEVRWLVDGQEYFRITPASLPAGANWVFDHDFYLLLNLSVGGVWPGPPDSSTPFPADMLVDYVRVYS